MTRIIKSATELEYKDDLWRVEWIAHTFQEKETLDRWLVVFKKSENDFVEVDEDDPIRREVINDFIKKRVEDLHVEYGTPTSIEEMIEFSEKIIRRSWAGEWMAQRNSWFYIDNLAEVLKTDFREAARITGILEERKIVGLNGFIIIPWEEAEETRKSLEKSTGHKDLQQSDFGGWSCSYCFRSSDERGPRPSEVECIEPEIILKHRRS